MSNKSDTSRWCTTNERWIPKGVAERWYIPGFAPADVRTHAGYDVIFVLSEMGTGKTSSTLWMVYTEGYWLVGANDQECNGERIGPYATLEQAQAAAEMLEAANV